MIGGLEVVVVGSRVAHLCARAPVAAKILEGPVGPELILVGSAAGLLEGDVVDIDITIEAGAHLTVRSTAATLAHPCPGGESTLQTVTARLGPGASLAWLAEPLVACAGCRHRSRHCLTMAEGAAAVWYEACTLGRSGEQAGPVDLRLDVTLAGRPLLRDGLRAGLGARPGGGDPATSPAVLGGRHHVGSVHLLGRRPPSPVEGSMALAGPGATVRAVAQDAATLERTLSSARISFLTELHNPVPIPRPGAGEPKEALVHG